MPPEKTSADGEKIKKIPLRRTSSKTAKTGISSDIVPSMKIKDNALDIASKVTSDSSIDSRTKFSAYAKASADTQEPSSKAQSTNPISPSSSLSSQSSTTNSFSNQIPSSKIVNSNLYQNSPLGSSPLSSPTTPQRATQDKQDTSSFSPSFKRTIRSEEYSTYHNSKNTKMRIIKLCITFVAVIALVFIITTFIFDRANISVEPVSAHSALDFSVTALSESASDTDMKFETMTLDHSVSRFVEADGIETVEQKASGTIVIFNEELKAQNFREETRFATADGLVFKLPKGAGIVVPAGSAENPGSVEAVVYAAEPGSNYNIGLSDFTIPGWKEINDNRFNTQYARSKTEMTGGSMKDQPKVSKAVMDSVSEEMNTELRTELTERISAEVPDTMIFFPNTFQISIKNPEFSNDATTGKTRMTLRGEITIPLFPKDNFTKIITRQIAKNNINNALIDNETTISNINDITVEIPIAIEQMQTLKELQVNIKSDDAIVLGVVDESKLSTALLGNSIESIQDIMKDFPIVSRALVGMRPVWKKHFPKSVKKINIEIVAPEFSTE